MGNDSIRERLEKRRIELRERLETITQDLTRASQPLDPDFAEQAVERENDEVLESLAGAARTEMQKIRKALLRMDAGDFGLCTKCGEPIAEGRLAALPFADRCVGCAE